jgi:hypothetical protein
MSPGSILVVATDMNIPVKKEQNCLWHYKCYPWTIHACLKTSHGTFKIQTTTCVNENSIWTANPLLLIRLSLCQEEVKTFISCHAFPGCCLTDSTPPRRSRCIPDWPEWYGQRIQLWPPTRGKPEDQANEGTGEI